jgi:acyl-CoA thioester hydrolase
MSELSRPQPHRRGDYIAFRAITTRWMDNDAYGHVNNASYFSFFDTAVSGWLWENGYVIPGQTDIIGLAVSSACDYFESLAFPDPIEAGLRVAKMGRSSVRYDVAIFGAGASQAAAQGHFVHVYVDRLTRRPIGIPAAMREALARLMLGA